MSSITKTEDLASPTWEPTISSESNPFYKFYVKGKVHASKDVLLPKLTDDSIFFFDASLPSIKVDHYLFTKSHCESNGNDCTDPAKY